ncbi:MAG: hypothetical protein K9N35_10790 [Candidatus Marinimicrobia bacterium]|nr:hypothetical protein [Candidatus Neomarinimicrobiota bacterium]
MNIHSSAPELNTSLGQTPNVFLEVIIVSPLSSPYSLIDLLHHHTPGRQNLP